MSSPQSTIFARELAPKQICCPFPSCKVAVYNQVPVADVQDTGKQQVQSVSSLFKSLSADLIQEVP